MNEVIVILYLKLYFVHYKVYTKQCTCTLCTILYFIHYIILYTLYTIHTLYSVYLYSVYCLISQKGSNWKKMILIYIGMFSRAIIVAYWLAALSFRLFYYTDNYFVQLIWEETWLKSCSVSFNNVINPTWQRKIWLPNAVASFFAKFGYILNEHASFSKSLKCTNLK